MKFQTWGKRPLVYFELKPAPDGRLFAVFANEDDADFARTIGMFRHHIWCCFDGYMNSFCVEELSFEEQLTTEDYP